MKSMEEKVRNLQELRRFREQIDAEIAAAEDEIKAEMGDSDTLLAGAYKVTWKAYTQTRLDGAALKKALPDIAAMYSKTVTCRRFTIT